MSRIEIPSFPFAGEQLSLEVSPGILPEGAIEEKNAIDLLGAHGSGRAQLTLGVEVDSGLLEQVLPGDELDNPPVEVVVVEQSDQGRVRSVHTLEGVLPGRATGEWERELDEVFGVLALTPMLVRTREGAGPPFASHAGAILATGEPFEVQVDERPPRAGNYLDIQFVSFSDEGAKEGSKLAGLSDLVYYLDTSEGDSAVLFLNSDIEHLQDTLNTPASPRGMVKRIKESTFSAITAHVWEQLASRALAQVTAAFDDDEVEPGEAASVDFVEVWAADVIRELASALFDNRSLEANIAELEENLIARRLELDNLIGLYAQRQANPVKAFNGLILVKERRA